MTRPLCSIPRLILVSPWTHTHMLLCFNNSRHILHNTCIQTVIFISICFLMLSIKYNFTIPTRQYATRFEILSGVTILSHLQSLSSVP